MQILLEGRALCSSLFYADFGIPLYFAPAVRYNIVYYFQ